MTGLDGYGFEIVERVSLCVESNNFNRSYLNTKKDKLGHLFDVPLKPSQFI